MLPPSLQDSLPAGWLAFAGRASTLWIATKGFRSHSHPPFLDLSWRKGSFILNLPLASHHSITSSARASSVSCRVPSRGICGGLNNGSGLLSGAEHELGARI